MIDVTPEVRQAIADAGDEPVRLQDPETGDEYVLIKADQYQRIRSAIEPGFDPESNELISHMWHVMRDEWDDEEMDIHHDDSAGP